MGQATQALAAMVKALGPYATCVIVIAVCGTLLLCVSHAARVISQIVNNTTVARLKDGELELRFRKPKT